LIYCSLEEIHAFFAVFWSIYKDATFIDSFDTDIEWIITIIIDNSTTIDTRAPNQTGVIYKFANNPHRIITDRLHKIHTIGPLCSSSSNFF
jgi:hypothetical protein